MRRYGAQCSNRPCYRRAWRHGMCHQCYVQHYALDERDSASDNPPVSERERVMAEIAAVRASVAAERQSVCWQAMLNEAGRVAKEEFFANE